MAKPIDNDLTGWTAHCYLGVEFEGKRGDFLVSKADDSGVVSNILGIWILIYIGGIDTLGKRNFREGRIC